MKIKKVIFIFSFLFLNSLAAEEIRYLARSPKALLMGDAFTAIADDEYTLFYNPAALGFNKGIKLSLINPDSHTSNLLNPGTMTKLTTISSDPTKVAESLAGVPIDLHLSIVPTVKMRNFAISFFLNHRSHFNIKNAVHPVWGIDFIYDRGMVFGGAVDFKIAGGQSALGMSIKSMNRRGFSGNFDLFGPTILNKLNQGKADINSIRQSLGDATSRTTYGLDLGWMYKRKVSGSTLSLGLSVMDLFDTQFKRIEGSRDLPNQEMLINFGAAWTSESTWLDYTISLDAHPINETLDFARRMHVGLNVAVPFVDVLFGWNGGYLSYGASVNVLLGKLTAGFYGTEVGSSFGQLEASRLIVYWSLLDVEFGY